MISLSTVQLTSSQEKYNGAYGKVVEFNHQTGRAIVNLTHPLTTTVAVTARTCSASSTATEF